MTDGTPLPLAGPGVTMRALAARAEELRRDVTRPVLVIGARGLGKRYLAERIHAGSSLAAASMQVIDARHSGDPAALETLRTMVTGVVLVRHVDRLTPAAQTLLEAQVAAKRVTRLLATSRTELLDHAGTGTFRATLGYELQGWPLLLPALADRDADVRMALAVAVLRQTADGDDTLPAALDATAATLLMTWPWQDNLREFEATLALAQLRARGSIAVSAAHLALPRGSSLVPAASAPMADVERWHLLRALAECQGNRTHTARQLGISRMTLIGRLRAISEAESA